MTARRPLLTAVAAGSLLCAVWFVPTANATAERSTHASAVPQDRDRAASAPRQSAGSPASGAVAGGGQLALAQTGGFDTTPYVVGGIAFVGAGGALVTAAVRRSRQAVR